LRLGFPYIDRFSLEEGVAIDLFDVVICSILIVDSSKQRHSYRIVDKLVHALMNGLGRLAHFLPVKFESFAELWSEYAITRDALLGGLKAYLRLSAVVQDGGTFVCQLTTFLSQRI
jgi:hypothetical protein